MPPKYQTELLEVVDLLMGCGETGVAAALKVAVVLAGLAWVMVSACVSVNGSKDLDENAMRLID